MTEDQANAVYDVLVAHAGAGEFGRESFVSHSFLIMAKDLFVFRFGGGLGPSGAFYSQLGGMWVDASINDLDEPGRLDMLDETNAALAALRDAVSR